MAKNTLCDMHFCMDEMALRSQIFVDKSGLIEKTNCISGMTIKRCRSVKNKITYLITKKATKIDGVSFFCYHKCGKRDRDTMCGKWKITEKKEEFLWKKHFRQGVFPSG